MCTPLQVGTNLDMTLDVTIAQNPKQISKNKPGSPIKKDPNPRCWHVPLGFSQRHGLFTYLIVKALTMHAHSVDRLTDSACFIPGHRDNWQGPPAAHKILASWDKSISIDCLLGLYDLETFNAIYQERYRLVIVHSHADIYSAPPTGKSGRRHHVVILHAVTLSRHCATQSLPYQNNYECKARRQSVPIL